MEKLQLSTEEQIEIMNDSSEDIIKVRLNIYDEFPELVKKFTAKKSIGYLFPVASIGFVFRVIKIGFGL